ncbi:MAG TPA: VIT domain-containing protein [Allosphingosinicella sp.]
MPDPSSVAFRLRAALLLILALLCAGPAAAAEPANPHLSALVRGVDDDENRRETLRIGKLDISVHIHGGIADTILTARFVNPGEESLEADFGLALPAGSVVTGYALDIEGEMIEGVLLDQRKARRAYQERVRQTVDPGLGEVLRGFQFRSRVSPVPPRSARTIRIRFSTPLDPKLGYVLPLSGGAEVEDFVLTVEAGGLSRQPAVTLPDGTGLRPDPGPGPYRLSVARTQLRLRRALAISAVERAAPLLVSRHPSGDAFFELADTGTAQAASRGPRSVAVLWDRSLSRADDDLAAEAALLRAYLERVRPERTELILFDSAGVDRIAIASPDGLAPALAAVRYRGGSSVAVLSPQAIDAEACLLFTDGLVTIDRREDWRPSCPLFAVSSAPDSDRPWLAAVAAASGGQAVHLAGGNGAQLLDRLTGAVPRVLAVRTTAGTPIDYSLLDAPDAGWRLVAPVPRSGGIVVRLAGPDGRSVERVYAMPAADMPRLTGPGALWASERLALRAASDDTDRDALVAFARRHRVSGPDISFLVLESPEDYARAGIEPPPGLAPEKRQTYERLVAQRRSEEQQQRDKRLETVLAAWEEQKAWWNQRFDPNAKPARPRDQDGNLAAPAPAPPPLVEAVPPPPAPDVLDELPAAEASEGAAGDEGDITVTGTRISLPNLSSMSPVTVVGGSEIAGQGRTTIEVAEWSADRPYLKALAAAEPAQLESVLAAQQAEHGGLPAFWLDVSDWYFRTGRRADALRLLLSALDLPTRDSETVAIVAARLVRWGELDRAIRLYERLAAAESDRPQPLRSLALALARRAEAAPPEQARADLDRAIALLTEVVMTEWPRAFEGIEMIALMEVNRLIARQSRLGGGPVPLDPRLVALLDVDLRVVIEWNTEETDLDLWVDEPNGERAIYSNPRTLIGGRLSNDMTAGYGPEEYLLRRAPRGTYTVRANVFASDRLNPNGSSRITAHLIHDFGRASEREEVIDVEALPGAESGERLIGRLRVER